MLRVLGLERIWKLCWHSWRPFWHRMVGKTAMNCGHYSGYRCWRFELRPADVCLTAGVLWQRPGHSLEPTVVHRLMPHVVKNIEVWLKRASSHYCQFNWFCVSDVETVGRRVRCVLWPSSPGGNTGEASRLSPLYLRFIYPFLLTFRHRACCILGQAFCYSPGNAFYVFNQQIYFIIWYMLDRASLI